MTHSTSMACLSVDGTSALAAAHGRPALTLIEGGAGRAPKARAQQGGLTRAQTLAVSALCVAVVCALGLLALVTDALSGAAALSSIESVATERVVVQEGDTLWGIAQGRCPEGVSTSELVSWISAENGIGSGALLPGQALVVPVAS